MPEWIEAAAKELYWLPGFSDKDAAAIIQRHYDAASTCGICYGTGKKPDVCLCGQTGICPCKHCHGTGKVVPS